MNDVSDLAQQNRTYRQKTPSKGVSSFSTNHPSVIHPWLGVAAAVELKKTKSFSALSSRPRKSSVKSYQLQQMKTTIQVG